MSPPQIRYFPATIRAVPPEGEGAREIPTDDTGRIQVALSSEFAVDRMDWWTGERYQEVLDHSAKSVDLMRAELAGGLPLIANHDTRDFRGKVEDISIDSDRKMRGWMRFSRSQVGQEARQDVLDGLLTSVSIGYRVSENFDQTEEKGQVTRTYRQWEPLELSLVPVPADPTVGAGRGHPALQPPASRDSTQPTAPKGQGVTMSDKDTAPSGAAAIVRDVGAEDRVKRLGEIATEFKVEDKLPGWIANGTEPTAALRETAQAIQARMTAPVAAAAPTLDLNDKDARRYSYGRAILAAAGDPAIVPRGMDVGFEREMAQELIRKMPHLAGKHLVRS